MMDPIYLLACGIMWRKVADVDAGGELAHALSDGDPDIRLLARHLLVAVCPISTLLSENAISSGVRLPMEAPQCESQTAKAQLNYAAYAADQREIAEILIIDDEDEVLVKLEEVLEAAGYRTTTTWCARQAASLLEEKQFDLILLDDYLGGTDWRYVLRGLCQKSKNTPVVVLDPAPKPVNRLLDHSCGASVLGIACKFCPSDVLEAVTACAPGWSRELSSVMSRGQVKKITKYERES